MSRLLIFLLVITSAATDAAEPETRPNVVFILADDLGWSELGCYGNDFNETPHLDRMASEGVRFTNAYAVAPVCSPYRAGLLTGQHPARVGITDYLRPNSVNALSTTHVTLAEAFRDAGYATGMIGKWHLTGYASHDAEREVTPREHGFEWETARERQGVANGVNFWPYLSRRTETRWLDLKENALGDNEFLVDRMNHEAVRFIEEHRSKPFFLYLSHYAPHTIVNGKPDLVAKYVKKHPPGPSSKTKCVLCSRAGLDGCPQHHWATTHNPHLAAMLESIDDGVGEITATLQRLGLAENTILIFTSDNGGETNVTSNAPLRGGKSQLYEGGLRVPLLVRWPAELPSAMVCESPTVNLDFYPTLLEAADITPPAEQLLDGVSLLKTWKEPQRTASRRRLYWHYPLDRPHFLGGRSGGAIRDGDWKLVEFYDDARVELYSLAEDPSEARDVSDEHPEVARGLRRRLDAWRDSVSARTPSPPLLTEARQLLFADHFSSGRASARWHFNADWTVTDGVLQRVSGGARETRVFVKDPSYEDVLIRFDFRLGESRDLRLVTGSHGHYNAVIHIRPDHFSIQTAQDESGPYFSYRHGECAYNFDPARWYTMTVEFLGDELVAHIDHEHLAYARHPILDKERTYFAFQVDEHPASLDNVQILTAAQRRDVDAGRTLIERNSGRHPVEKPLAEQHEIRRRNAHEWHYQRDEAYRALVAKVDEWDATRKARFPEVFRSHKEFRKRIQAERKRLLDQDPRYKEFLFATYRAERAITEWLTAQHPDFESLPESRRKYELERLRARHQQAEAYRELVATRDRAQAKLEATYPQLFVSDADIHAQREARRKQIKHDPEFQRLNDQRAAAWRAQEQYLYDNDETLAELRRKLDAEKN